MNRLGLGAADGRRSEHFSDPRRIFFPLVVAILAVVGCEFRPSTSETPEGAGSPPDSSPGEIQDMLQASADSWNAGDLDGFLDDYWESDELTFSGAGGVTRGWADVRNRYLEGYWSPGVARDSLRFEELEVMPLGQDHALALGRYALFRPEEGGRITSSGFFSLVLRNVEGSWKILHDHTSTSPVQDGPGSDTSETSVGG